MVIALLLPRQYVSSAIILPEDEQVGSPIAALLGQAGLPFAGNLFAQGGTAEIQKEILLSYSLASRVVAALNLYVPYEMEDEREKNPIAAEQDAVFRLRNEIGAELSLPSQVILLWAKSREPELSRDIVARYILELERFNRETMQEAGRRKRVFLEERFEQVVHDRREASEAIEDFSARNGIVYLPAELEGELALVAEINRRLVFKELDRASLAQDSAPDSPGLDLLDSEIAVLRGKLDELETGRGDSSIKFTPLEKLPALSLEYFRLQRELRIQQEIGDLLTQQLEQAKLQEANNVSTVNVLDAPLAPTLPAAPRKKIVVLLGTFLGLLLLCGWVLIRDFYDRIRSDRNGSLADWAWLPGAKGR